MKKIISLLLLVCVCVFAFAACSNPDDGEKNYTLAIGVTVTENLTTLEVAQTVAALVIDGDGKIVQCRIDSLAAVATVTDGVVDYEDDRTKMELGDEYGMLDAPYGSTLAEWDDQIKALESFVVGKTQAEVAAITGDETDLVAGCTIAIDDYLKAIDNAFKDAYKVSFSTDKAVTLGVAMVSDIADKEGNANYTNDMAAVAMADGKVVAATIDSIDATITIGDDGVGTAYDFAGTKRTQGDDYGMLGAPYGSTLAEWYDQVQAYANSAVGKTASELSSLATEGVAGCTIYAGGYKAAIVKAASYVR